MQSAPLIHNLLDSSFEIPDDIPRIHLKSIDFEKIVQLSDSQFDPLKKNNSQMWMGLGKSEKKI